MRLLFVLFCATQLFLPSLKAQSLSCNAPLVTTPCGYQAQTGVSADLLPVTALNPVHLGHGTKHAIEVDLYPHPASPHLSLSRHYHSGVLAFSALGTQWSHGYDLRLQHQSGSSYLVLADGSTQVLLPHLGRLTRTAFYAIWQPANSTTQWHFNQQGWLIKIQPLATAPLLIQRHSQGQLAQQVQLVTQGPHSLRFHYLSPPKQAIRLSHVESPIGTIRYTYDQPIASALFRLQQVDYPDHRRLHYHYESQYQQQHPWALTGKSIQQHPLAALYRIRSWVYDDKGRVIFMMPELASNWARLHYEPQQTLIHSANGLTTIQFTDTQKQHIQQVSGANCWGCPPRLRRDQNTIYFENFQIKHDKTQHIQHISGNFPGWPQLQLNYDHAGRLNSWQTALQQKTHLIYAQNRPQRLIFANGDQQQLHYNEQQQVTAIQYKNQQSASKSTLQRPGPRQLHIANEHEQETVHLNNQGQITQRLVQRQLQTAEQQTIQWHYQEKFEYDEKNRLITHHLPEGGSLLYHWDNKQLTHIFWQNKAQHKQQVLHKQGDLYVYANGTLQWQRQSSAGFYSYVDTEKDAWWQFFFAKNTKGLVSHTKHHFHLLNTGNQRTLRYNAADQVIVNQSPNRNTAFYAWENSGALRANNHQKIPQITRDKSGLPIQWQNQQQNYMLSYLPSRQLHIVSTAEKMLQKNDYNAAGFRIYTQHYPQAKQQFFLYHHKQIVAEYNASLSAKLPIHATHPLSRRYIYIGNRPIALIDYEQNPSGELLVMHSDPLGAVHIISDLKQQTKWLASYDLFGKATLHKADINFNLRREGQYYDLATGWHKNLLRTYLPEQGFFLEPDPLGPTPFSQQLGALKQQPLNHTDPWGLLLFSFDGTRYDHTSGGVIHELHQAHQDDGFYVAGPGNPSGVDWDAAVAYSTPRIVQQQWQRLLDYLQHNTSQNSIPIDIIGFSRGSAIALHFANQIMAHTQQGLFSLTTPYGEQIQACIEPRFIGLLDTVTQIGALGSQNYKYDFSVAPAWQWIVHGVALHEYRYIMQVHLLGNDNNRLETGFIGAHGDLGGGYAAPNDTQFQPLSNIAKQWLVWQARAQGLRFNEGNEKNDAPYAYLHSENSLFELDRPINNYRLPFDRDSDVRNRQGLHPALGLRARQQVQAFINFELSADQQMNNQQAIVDLNAYYRWLDSQLQWSPN